MPRSLTLADVSRAAALPYSEALALAAPVIDALTGATYDGCRFDSAGVPVRGAAVYAAILDGRFTIEQLAAARRLLIARGASLSLTDEVESAHASPSPLVLLHPAGVDEVEAHPAAAWPRTGAGTLSFRVRLADGRWARAGAAYECGGAWIYPFSPTEWRESSAVADSAFRQDVADMTLAHSDALRAAIRDAERLADACDSAADAMPSAFSMELAEAASLAERGYPDAA